MAKKPTITTVSSGYNSATTLNANLEALRDAFENTISRDGSTPNTMLADLDLNSNDILNAGTINADDIVVDGSSVAASAAAAAASAAAALVSENAAAASYDSFDDTYLGAKASAPTTDNDGDALATGALYFNTGDNLLYVWNGSAWQQASTGALLIANDLSDLNSAPTARTNLGVAIGTDVQAWDADLDAIAALASTDGNFIVGTGASWTVEGTTTAQISMGLLDSEDAGGFVTGLRVPSGTTAERPATPDGAEIRYNETVTQFEGYDGSAWTSIGGSGRFKGENGETGDLASGLGDIFRVHEQTLNTNVTIDADENALATGPLTIASGVTLTITSGGNLTIV